MSAEPWTAHLPDGHLWIACQHEGRLIAVIGDFIPVGSKEERLLAEQAEQEWRRGTRGGLMGLPIAAGLGAWSVQQLRKPAIAAAAAFTAGATAAALTTFAIPHGGSHSPPQAAPGSPPSAVALPPVGHQPPRVGPPKSGPPATARPVSAPRPHPSGNHPAGPPPLVSLPRKVPVHPPVTVTVTPEPPSPTDTCRLILPKLLKTGLLCGSV